MVPGRNRLCNKQEPQLGFCAAKITRWFLPDYAGVFQTLVDQPKTAKDAEIVRDLNRTYPGHIYYQQRQGPGQLSLYNVLKAYSAYDAKVQTWPCTL